MARGSTYAMGSVKVWNVDRGFGELEVDSSEEHREHEWAVRAGRYPDENSVGIGED